MLLSFRAAHGHSSRLKGGRIRCLEREREALLKFKDELVDEYGRLASWGTHEDKKECCTWKGVRCHNQTSHVIELDLRGSFDGHLRGNISPWLLEIRHLNYLDLSYNDFNGSRIPKFIGSFGRLQHLDLSDSNLGGHIPHHLGNLSELQFLSVGYNSMLTSTNLDWLSTLRSLSHLDLSHVNLTFATDWLPTMSKLTRLQLLHMSSCHLPPLVDPLPSMINASNFLSDLSLYANSLPSSSVFPWLFNFSSSLINLDVRLNNLQGPIPNAIGNIASLEDLDLHVSSNIFNGTLTERIGSLSKLENLNLRENRFEGVITEAHFFGLSRLNFLQLESNLDISFNFSSGWNPPFQLTFLWLGDCKLGPHFPAWLHTQKQLRYLDISNAEIHDALPDWFWDLSPTLYFFNASHNNIHGILPDLSSKFSTDTTYIDLSSNQFNCLLPSLPLKGSVLDFSNNKFWGSITDLCSVASSWVYLDLSKNLLSGQLPDCFANQMSLKFLNLAYNNFSGKIPLPNNISSLHLQNNNFTGEISASLRNCTSLRFLDLSKNKLTGEIPTWLGDHLSKLVLLNLRSNRFLGTIPLNLCYLPRLQVLDISSNKISGAIPKCLSNLTAMVHQVEFESDQFNYPMDHVEGAELTWKRQENDYIKSVKLMKLIDLSSNTLVGEIPPEITGLASLVALNLSRNNLSGLLPVKIGQLRSLDFLDLSRNHISGGIPDGLSQLDGLGVLDLSYNNLSGKIPFIAHLQTFEASAYVGNSGLCGPPLTKPCPGNESSLDPKFNENEKGIESPEEEDEFITLGFYIAMTLGFIIGFWGVFGTLQLNKSCKSAFFGSMEWLYVKIVVNKNRLQNYFAFL
ncbi:unnamed protein product [Fraxinus pennsylvanica]|uniref:Leucine-rich repeat-containing N-terminal plant-type domain-containing protein n=1 Tax=Fraxinus pennsylvanica TaxID=56036 RepID=A0AAD1ZEW9_9LAMI|nr:unnamed protein product [Fraxinus pennsylvanica]